MTVRVYLTQMLQRHLNMKSDFTVDAKNLGELFDKIDSEHKGFRDSVCDESGRIRTYVNVFLNGQRVGQDTKALSTRLGDDDEVYILASVAGGSS